MGEGEGGGKGGGESSPESGCRNRKYVSSCNPMATYVFASRNKSRYTFFTVGGADQADVFRLTRRLSFGRGLEGKVGVGAWKRVSNT